ncbi:MAG: DNA translocase FtsK 4TM domain-containing protein [Planctomycetota bacterium]|nr:DNA translocase FtsK 4TM domain-containing protein [Planctomycetota bacterium]
MKISERGIQKLRTCGVFTALLVCTFTWVALVTFDVNDWPNTAVSPQNDPANNGCGRVGAWVGHQLFRYFGAGSYTLLVFMTLAAVVKMIRPITDIPLRLIGLSILATCTAAAASMYAAEATEGFVEGRGGILGIAVAAALQKYFAIFSLPILVFAAIVGFLLTADDLVSGTRSAIRWIRQNGLSGLAALRTAGLGGGGLRPVMIGAGNGAGGPTVVMPDAEDVDEDVETEDEEDEDDEESDDDAEDEYEDPADESDEDEDAPLPPERQLIVRMLGKDRSQGKVAPSAWPKELGDYVLPPLTLLGDPTGRYSASQEQDVREKAATLERTLNEFRIEGHVVEIDTGPVITLFEVDLAAGIKVSQINSIANDIARALKAPAVRIVATIPGKNTIGIEVPNVNKEKVRLKELMMLGGVKPTKMALPPFLGKDASGNALIVDTASMPHMLIAGTTGSGKSVCLNALVMSILMTQRPDHVKLILIDPKMVELSIFKEIPHLMCPIVTDMQRAEMILHWATIKMDERYELLAEAGVKDIASFNRLGKEAVYERFQPTTDEEKLRIPTHLPYIVILIDELADLMMTSGKEVEQHLSRLAQKSRAIGIHLVVATQRPQANVVTGLIKSNLPCRVAFRVASRMDSRIVLDQNGAEVLMGEGDMLFLPPGSAKLVRSQGTYIEDDELRAVVADLKTKAQPQFLHELTRLRPDAGEGGGERDPLFDRAVDIIVETKRGSVSLLQRRLEIGYSRASRLIDQMAEAGIVGEYKGSQAREVLITKNEWGQIKKHRDQDIADGFEADMEESDDDPQSDGGSESEFEDSPENFEHEQA